MTKLGEKQISWTKEEKESFKHDWQFLKKKEILKKYKRPYTALTSMARLLGVKKSFTQNHYKLIKLLDETNISYYWLGFIIADGCFTKNYLKIGLAKVDYNHLLKFSKYINIKAIIAGEKCLLTCRDSYTVPIIQNQFNIVDNKTYNGADFNIGNKQLFFSFLAGLIDGDGCFCLAYNKKVNMIRIHCHKSYYDFYSKISLQLKIYGIESRVYFCSKGYVKFVISKQKYFKILNSEVKNCNIPLLERKWDRLNNTIKC